MAEVEAAAWVSASALPKAAERSHQEVANSTAFSSHCNRCRFASAAESAAVSAEIAAVVEKLSVER